MEDDRPSFLDTLTGFDPWGDDPLMRALVDVDHALDERGAALEKLRKKSDPPPPLPPTPALAA